MIRCLLLTAVCILCASQAHAEWYLRGSHNGWGADQMEDVGSNTMLARNVVFESDGAFKFDRWAEWSENYGTGGRGGSNIGIAAGTYNIRFYTDTKDWVVSVINTNTGYHFRGTPNSWAEGTLLDEVSGTTLYQTCQDFSGQTNPRFKIDPNGGWGGDEFPDQDIIVSASWVRVTVDSNSDSIVSVEEDLGPNCSEPQAELHLRGTLNAWAAGTLLDRIGSTDEYEICAEFASDGRFKIDPNGGWGGDEFPAADVNASGWTYIRASETEVLEVTTDQDVNCEEPTETWYVSGTFNNWGQLEMTDLGNGTYTASINITSGDQPALLQVEGGFNAETFPTSGPLTIDFCASYDINFNANTNTLSTPIKTADLPVEQCSMEEVSVKDFRDETIYFVFTDRFADGDPTNNTGNNAATYDSSRSDYYKHFGGDVQGIIDNLDYLQALGVTAIWTTPLVDNTDFVESINNQAGYHGYWTRDFFEIDEHMGDWALVDELIAELDARGMKFVVDFAPNHTSNIDYGSFGQLFRNGTPVSGTVAEDANLPVSEQWFNHQGSIDADQNNSCDASYYNCVPVSSCDGVPFCVSDWDASPQNQVKGIFGLSDLDVTKSFVEDYMFEAAANWIDHGAKGFRIDAIKHFDHGFMRNLANRLNDYAIAQGMDGIYIVGEWWDAGVGQWPNGVKSQAFIAETPNVELLDFSLRYSMESVIAGDLTFEGLNSALEARTAAWSGREHSQGIFLDNHDVVRTGVQLRSNKGMSPEFAARRIDLGFAMVMTLPGVPIIYYGSEQYLAEFTNGGRDPYNRPMMTSFDQGTPAYSIISTLANLRKNSPAIQTGTYTQRWMNSDIIVYERQEGNDVVLVALNRGNATSINVSNLAIADGTYSSLVGSDQVTISGGSTTLNLDQNEIIVLH